VLDQFILDCVVKLVVSPSFGVISETLDKGIHVEISDGGLLGIG
jgi:hypothetical protein